MPDSNVAEPRSAFNGEPFPAAGGKALCVSWPQAARSAAVGLDTTWLTDSTPSPSAEQRALMRRAERRAVSKALARALVRVTKNSHMKRGYNRTVTECCEKICQADGSMVTRYCKMRWCAVCSAMRTARLIEKYSPELETFLDPHFVTLTVKSVSSYRLRPTLQGMAHSFRMCIQQARRKHPGVKIRAVRSLEVTFSNEQGFHPHYHVVVEGRSVAKEILRHWVKTREDSSHMGQDLRRADSGSMKELFKYCVKVSVDGGGIAPAWSLNEIFESMFRLKQVQPYGLAMPTPDEDSLETVSMVKAFKNEERDMWWDWAQSVRDWVDFDTGEVLADYSPEPKMEDFITKIEKLRE